MNPYLQDADLTLYHGDVREVLAGLESESVHCVVTSPPYWGLRDYGTGSWEGGDAECDHQRLTPEQLLASKASSGLNLAKDHSKAQSTVGNSHANSYGQECGKCGATRIDNQLGLEPTPDEYVANMVGVFREVRRVLRGDGTCWLNMGDSYAGSWGAQGRDGQMADRSIVSARQIENHPRFGVRTGSRAIDAGLKPKDLCMIPARLALALQADGWWLRSQIVWSKPNPMPESVTDRPTTSHEFVYLLAKGPRYFFDQEAVREQYHGNSLERSLNPRDSYGSGVGNHRSSERVGPIGVGRGPDGRKQTGVKGQDGSLQHRDGERWPNPTGRNLRSVWEIPTQPYPEAHFATYPEELVRRCILAGCPEGGVVLDPFFGSGTTGLVARKHGRKCVGIELNLNYCRLSASRLQQLSLLAEVVS